MKIDKQNGNVCFNEEQHLYWNIKDPNKTYTSVTTLIHTYVEKFDEIFWGYYKALEKLVGDETFKQTLVKKNLLATKKWDNKYAHALGVSV